MRSRTLIAVGLALVLALGVPGLAAAAKGGVPGPPGGTPPGQAKKAPVAPTDETTSEDETVPTPDPDPAAAPAGKVRAQERRAERDAAREASGTWSPGRPSTDTSGTKLTGIANALSRIEKNIAKSEAKVLAGKKKAVSSGLLGVYAKFSNWLGLSSDEPTGTPDPGGSTDTTVTVEPTSTIEPTSTVP